MGQSTSQRVCANCGTPNSPGDAFCSNCGFDLKTSRLTGTIVSNLSAPTVAPPRRITGALAPGTLIGARYNIMQLLGRGGFGAVYLASDNRFPARRVAVKEMGDAQLSPGARAHAIANFRQEADLLSRLQHINLPAVSDFLEEGGKAYMIMDFINGCTLDEVQQAAGGPLEETLVMGWAYQICEVLDYLHNQPQPIVFRDLKPSNIMVTPSNQIKLIDFGIARIFKSSATKDTNSLGSQGYAAPEQYGLEQTDARTDIYALGATLYDLLTDQVPQASFARKINPQALTPPRQLNARITPGVEEIILHAIQIEKSRRYQSAAEMARAIFNLGLFSAHNTGGRSALTGPNAVTIAATRPGNYLTNATLNPAPTQAGGGPITPAPAPAQQSGAAVVAQTQLQGPANPYVSTPSAGPGQSLAPAAPLSGRGLSGGSVPPLPGSGSQRGSSVSRRGLLIGGSTAALAIAAGIYAISRHGQPQNLPPGETIPVAFAYSTEKAAWLQPAVSAFNNSEHRLHDSNRVINIQLTDLGSVDGQAQILSGQIKPAAWSPASTLEINRLNYKWQQAHQGDSIINYNEQFQPRSLVKSPLVLAAWQERAHALLNHYQVPTLDWDKLHDAFIAQDWTQVGGKPGWGPVKFGQTLPVQSNSGLLTITLLAYHHFKEPRGLTIAQVNDPGYAHYLHDFEAAVNAFGHSSGTYLKNDIIDGSGPAQADIIATYENLVLTLQAEAESRQHQPLLISYPDVNILSDHPFVVLQGNWVTDEQKQAALQFRDFLLDIPQQRLALSYGFRPVNSAIALKDLSIANNPFVVLAPVFPDRQPDALQSLAQAPGGDVVDALINNWHQNYPSPPTTDG